MSTEAPKPKGRPGGGGGGGRSGGGYKGGGDRERGGDRDRGGERGGGPGGKKKGYFRGRARKVCEFCVDKDLAIDYKNVDQMRKYINDRGKIKPRRATGCCAKHQRKVTTQVKRAREIALIPYTRD